MRDVAEHFDYYAIHKGKNKNIIRYQLEVSSMSESTYAWLGYNLDINDALKASEKLFKAINNNFPPKENHK